MPPARSIDWIDRRCMIDCGMWRVIDRTRSTNGRSRRTIGSVDNTWIDCIHTIRGLTVLMVRAAELTVLTVFIVRGLAVLMVGARLTRLLLD